MGRLAWLFTLCLLALFFAGVACDGGDNDLEGFPLDSGIQGLVTIGPVCPVVQEGTACPDEPYQADIAILDEDGDEVVTFESGENGRFRVNLFPGRYTIVPASPNTGAPPFADEQQVEVLAGSFTEVAIMYDSGIR